MENQSSRYRDNNERMRRVKNEIRRREKRKRIFIAGSIGVIIIVIVILGYLVFVNFFSDGQQNLSNRIKNESEEVQETEYETSSGNDSVTSKINQASLEEIIVSAQKKADMADAENNVEGLEKLHKRIEEAKDLISENASEDQLGVAYLNLILAINEIE